MVIESISLCASLDKTANFMVVCSASLTGSGTFSTTVSFPTYVQPFAVPNGLAGGMALNVNRTNIGGDAYGFVSITGHYESLL
jgi:hypothetical protein